MGFWDKVKAFFVGPPAEPSVADDDSESGSSPPPAKGSRSSTQAPRAPSRAAESAPPQSADSFAAGEILGLSAKDMRARALKINPYHTAWIGRIDTIPPQSDERTALIDRGLILRGLLSKSQIDEIHRVGDIWLRHHDAAKLAEAVAAAKAQRAVDDMRARKAEEKRRKKEEAAQRKALRAEQVQRRREEDIVFLGRNVSASLADRRSHVEKLSEAGLPLLATPSDVAKALGITIRQLRWLCFHAEAALKSHYVYFEIPKRTGGTRLLAAPHRHLAQAQRWVLDNILRRISPSEPAHGFVAQRSTVTAAAPHVGMDVVVNLDLKDFFPTITFPRVRGLFKSMGYSPASATVLALLCTECPRTPVDHEGLRYWVAAGERALPQGACTSPAISNLVGRKLDRRLVGMSTKMGWHYTRYADDLTFSAPAGHREAIGILLARVRHILQEEGFQLHPRKQHIQRAARRQQVTGIVVNHKLAVPREEVRRLRAILHNARRTGLAAQNRDDIPHFESWLQGKIAYVQMVDAELGRKLAEQYRALTG
ncbi:MAG: RNA-directed DNA polymerase [Deltaproteobacteria bacterium]|nr:RNA-directed DNA polymerase [Deltaproteobacteria bacterium]